MNFYVQRQKQPIRAERFSREEPLPECVKNIDGDYVFHFKDARRLMVGGEWIVYDPERTFVLSDKSFHECYELLLLEPGSQPHEDIN